MKIFNHKNKKTYLIILFVFSLVFILANFCLAQLEVEYPKIGETEPPTTKTMLPGYVEYIFNLVILLSGLVAFGVLVVGGFRYLTSAGNPSVMSDSKDQIFSAFIGLIIVLSSYIILTTINPELKIINIEPLAGREGVRVIFSDDTEAVYSTSVDDFKKEVKEIQFDKDDLRVYLYPEKNWKGEKTEISPGSVTSNPKSMEIIWQTPGVYLCYDKNGLEICRAFQASTPSFGELNNKFTKIKFKHQKDKETGEFLVKYGAVVFDKENYEPGELELYLVANPIENWVSSIKVFSSTLKREYQGSVKICSQPEGGGRCESYSTPTNCHSLADSKLNDNVYSIEIEGGWLVILCDGERCDGYCDVLTKSDADLSNDPMGRCRSRRFLGKKLPWLKKLPCTSSFQLMPTR